MVRAAVSFLSLASHTGTTLWASTWCIGMDSRSRVCNMTHHSKQVLLKWTTEFQSCSSQRYTAEGNPHHANRLLCTCAYVIDTHKQLREDRHRESGYKSALAWLLCRACRRSTQCELSQVVRLLFAGAKVAAATRSTWRASRGHNSTLYLHVAAYIGSPSLSRTHRDVVANQQASLQVIAQLWEVVLSIAVHHIEWYVERL